MIKFDLTPEESRRYMGNLISFVENFVSNGEMWDYGRLRVDHNYSYINIARQVCAMSDITIDEKINFNKRISDAKKCLDKKIHFSLPPTKREKNDVYNEQCRRRLIKIHEENVDDECFDLMGSYEEEMRLIEEEFKWLEEHEKMLINY